MYGKKKRRKSERKENGQMYSYYNTRPQHKHPLAYFTPRTPESRIASAVFLRSLVELGYPFFCDEM